MALIHCNFFSDILGLSCSMDVILPQATQGQIGLKGFADNDKHPTLWLLHGLSDDHTIWQRRTSIERYVAPLGLAVVMPAVGRSFYTDMHAGPKYWTFVSEELPVIARSFFPLSENRKDNFVAGLSMGGYGAFKLGFRKPERFCAAASLSGALDMVSLLKRDDRGISEEMLNVFGPLKDLPNSENDLTHLAERLADSDSPRPKIFQCCGTQDSLYPMNLSFRDRLLELGFDVTYEEDDFDHQWAYWDQQIQHVLEWLPLGGSV